jgi:hypothetical protein
MRNSGMFLGLVGLLLALVSPSWGGGVHGVGSGGGFAEMQAVYVHQVLGSILAPCLGNFNPCRLSSEEREELIQVARAHLAETAAVRTVFQSTVDGNGVFMTERRAGAQITFASKALYNPDESLKSPAEIAAIVLAARWSHINVSAPIANLLTSARAIFAGFAFQIRSVFVVPAVTTAALRFYSVEKRTADGVFAEQVVFLEDTVETSDLSSRLQSELPCGALSDWQFRNWVAEKYENQVVFRGRMRSSCSATGWMVQIQVGLDGKGRMGKPDVIVRAEI